MFTNNPYDIEIILVIIVIGRLKQTTPMKRKAEEELSTNLNTVRERKR